ncbi:hypothetical protein FRC03_002132 [Tulasnella sp. 419]|nr:hypothetical protein FRC03_002132 [Tulasnella sp. 419]
MLKVSMDADEADLKIAFRNFARRFHPDKVGPGGEALFMKVRDAYEALKNPSKRFAYDRFGPEALTWENAITEQEYLWQGFLRGCGFYIVSVFVMGAWWFLGSADSGFLWRNILFLYLLCSELMLGLHPPSPYSTSSAPNLPLPLTFLQYLKPTWCPFQYASFLRQIYISITIAIAKVVPVLFPDDGRHSGIMSERERNDWSIVVNRLGAAVGMVDHEVSRMIRNEVLSMQRLDGSATEEFLDEEGLKSLTNEMENIQIETRLRSEPILRALWNSAVARMKSMGMPTVEVESRGATPVLVDESETLTGRRSMSPSPSEDSSSSREGSRQGSPGPSSSPPTRAQSISPPASPTTTLRRPFQRPQSERRNSTPSSQRLMSVVMSPGVIAEGARLSTGSPDWMKDGRVGSLTAGRGSMSDVAL